MPTVRNTSNRSYISDGVGRVDPGDSVDVSEDKAEYLVEETGYFDRVEATDVEFTELDETDADGEAEEEGDEDDLEDLLKDDLLEEAREAEIDGRSEMTKAELIVALEENEQNED